MNSHEMRVKSLMMAYSDNQLRFILNAFLYQMQDRVGLGALNVLTKYEKAVVLERIFILPQSSRLGDLHSKSFFNEMQWSRMEVEMALNKSRLATNRDQFGPRRSARVLTSRTYWQQRGRRALLREQRDRDKASTKPSRKQIEESLISKVDVAKSAESS